MKITSKHVIKAWSAKITNQNQWDHYGKCTCLRSMMYMIAKQIWEHKSIGPYKHGCISNIIHVCHKSNYHDIYHNNQETSKHAKKWIICKQVNIMGV